MARSHFYTISFDTGGVDVSDWKNLTKEEQEKAFSRPWRIIWFYRNPKTNKLERQKAIKAGVNRLKTVKERLHFMRAYKKAMIEVLDEGYNPYTFADYDEPTKTYSVKEALEYALSVKKETVGKQTYSDYELRVKDFLKYVHKHGRTKYDIKLISKKFVAEYLDTVLKKVSVRTRNNTKNALSALFTVLSENFIIETNFIKTDIPNIRQKKKTDRRFTRDDLRKISEHLKVNDPYLLLFLKMVSYNFLRPIEVSRLRVGDIDIEARELFFEQKTKIGKTKRIPEIYFNELKQLVEGQPKEFSIFAPGRKPSLWETEDKDKRDYWSKQFKRKVKDPLGIQTDMYGLRHSFITGLFVVLREKKKMSYDKAIEYLMRITGHTSKEGIEKYIHQNDADKPEDWSDLIDFKL